MWSLLKVYILFHLHFIFVKCSIQDTDDLSVRMLDKKMIEQKRQDTRDMCKIFNSEALKRTIPTDYTILKRKYEKRRQELKEKKEKQKKEHRRVKRALDSTFKVNPALKKEDEERVEKIVDKIYDELQERGEKIEYRHKDSPKADFKNLISTANKTGRRFPFAPQFIKDVTSVTRVPTNDSIYEGKTPRFPLAILPYFIDSKTYDSHLSKIIRKAFDYLEKATCIRIQRLRERPTDQKSMQNVMWLYITNPSGLRQCVHTNGRAKIKGVQMVVFGYDCMSIGDITHEMMHVLGFEHEHTRPDRDQYITILWDNIKPGYKQYFEVQDPVIENLPYDYNSVLHYPPRAFSKNGQLTILTEAGVKIGQREGLSEMDVEKIGLLYSNECVKRNREYLLKTCPSVMKSQIKETQVTEQEIDDYFEDIIWPFGVVNYKIKDRTEFTPEELENINAVMAHIERETCIQFKDLSMIPEPAYKEIDNSSPTEDDTRRNVSYVPIGTGENDTKPLPIFSSSETSGDFELNEIIKLRSNNETTGRRRLKMKTSNKTKQEKATARKKRAVSSPTPSRRHASGILILSRSPNSGCLCPLPGKPAGNYVMKIYSDCFNSVNDLLHIFVHVLGLDHQHNMHDRDSYLHIMWDELTEDVRQEMNRKLPPAASVGFPYDYQSVMHYPWLQIKNGRTNIMYPIWNDGWSMGHWQGLSAIDIQKINLLYFNQCMERRNHDDAELRSAKRSNNNNKKQ